jgi:hypothetical protein
MKLNLGECRPRVLPGNLTEKPDDANLDYEMQFHKVIQRLRSQVVWDSDLDRLQSRRGSRHLCTRDASDDHTARPALALVRQKLDNPSR